MALTEVLAKSERNTSDSKHGNFKGESDFYILWMALAWVFHTTLVSLLPFSSLKMDVTSLYWVKYFLKSRRGVLLMRCEFCFDVEQLNIKQSFTSLFFFIVTSFVVLQ